MLSNKGVKINISKSYVHIKNLLRQYMVIL